MKVRMPDTDQQATIGVHINGSEYAQPEFETRFEPDGSNIIECYVPIAPGDQIAVKGRFDGNVKYGAFDLICDGAFACDSRIESHGPEATKRSRIITWHKAIHSKKPENWKSSEWCKDSSEGDLYAKVLDEEVKNDMSKYERYDPDEPRPGVGSIEVVISITDQNDSYFDKAWDCYIGAWREKGVRTVRQPEIPPDHELGIDITDAQIKRKRSLKFLRHWEQTRFGPQPWARLIFYYRDMDAIMEAGALPVEQDKVKLLSTSNVNLGQGRDLDKSFRNPLNAEEQDDFTRGTNGELLSRYFTASQHQPEANTAKGEKKKAASPPLTVEAPPKGVPPQAEGVEAAKIASHSQGGTDAPSARKKRLGGTLVLEKETPTLTEYKANGGKKRDGTPSTLMHAMETYASTSSDQGYVVDFGRSTDSDSRSYPAMDEANKEGRSEGEGFDLMALFASGGANYHYEQPVIPPDLLSSDAEANLTGSPRYRPVGPGCSPGVISQEPAVSVGQENAFPFQPEASIGHAVEIDDSDSLVAAIEKELAARDEGDARYEDFTGQNAPTSGTQRQAQSPSQACVPPESVPELDAREDLSIAQSSRVREPQLQINADFDRLPALQDLIINIGPDGISRWDVDLIFDNNSPYHNKSEAHDEFHRRVAQVAEENPVDRRFYLKKTLEQPVHLLHNKTAYGIDETTTTSVVPQPPQGQEQEQERHSMDNFNKAPRSDATPGVKRQNTPNDTSARPAQRRRTQMTETSSTTASPTTTHATTSAHSNDDPVLAELHARKAEVARLNTEKRNAKAAKIAKLAAFRRQAEADRVAREVAARLAKEKAEREREEAVRKAKEELQQAEAEAAELSDDDDLDEELLRFERGQYGTGQDDGNYDNNGRDDQKQYDGALFGDDDNEVQFDGEVDEFE